MSKLDFSAMSDVPVKVREIILSTASGALRDHQRQVGDDDSKAPDAETLEALVTTGLSTSIERQRAAMQQAEAALPLLEAAHAYMTGEGTANAE